jgi:hypothetical protein
MAKFVVYEKVAESIYSVYPKKDMSDGLQTGVNLGSGLIAGFAAALVSQPADTMLSKINKTKGAPGEGTTTRLIKIAKELGFKGSYTGIGTRLFMVGTLTAFQFAIYVCSPLELAPRVFFFFTFFFFCCLFFLSPPISTPPLTPNEQGDVKKALGATGGVEIGK